MNLILSEKIPTIVPLVLEIHREYLLNAGAGHRKDILKVYRRNAGATLVLKIGRGMLEHMQ